MTDLYFTDDNGTWFPFTEDTVSEPLEVGGDYVQWLERRDELWAAMFHNAFSIEET